MATEAQRVARLIYEGKFTGKIDRKLTSLVAAKLSEAVMEGYGKSLNNVDFDSPDAKMIRNLEQNVYQFSAAKNYQELKTMTLAVKNSQGKIRPWAEFRDIAMAVDAKYNRNWLKSEYNAAVGSSQMASKWTGWEDDEHLKYSTVGDARVRDSHAALDGVIKKKTDPFWNTYYPPNGWGCRCNVVATISGEETPDHKILHPKVQEMWRVNTAKKGIVFPPGSPYYALCPKVVMKMADDMFWLKHIAESRKQLHKWASENLFEKVKIGKFTASRKEYKIEGLATPVIVNNNSIDECLSKYQNDFKSMLFRIDALYNIDVIMRKAKYAGREDAKHGKFDDFVVLTSFHKKQGVTIKCGVNNTGVYLHYLK